MNLRKIKRNPHNSLITISWTLRKNFKLLKDLDTEDKMHWEKLWGYLYDQHIHDMNFQDTKVKLYLVLIFQKKLLS